MPGAKEIISIVQESGLPIALVSASPRVLVNRALEHFEPGVFTTSVANNDVVNSKPDPESYLLGARLLGVNISECLVVEDSKTGIAAGVASGAYVLGVPHLVSIEPAPRLVLRDGLVGLTLTDLEEIVQTGHLQKKEQ
jgi:HAD superfamily hydrolase (TIGR01509 family)